MIKSVLLHVPGGYLVRAQDAELKYMVAFPSGLVGGFPGGICSSTFHLSCITQSD